MDASVLRFSRTFIDNVGREERLAQSDRRVETFLRGRVAELSSISASDVHAFIRQQRHVSYGYKIRSEQGVGLFCLLQCAMDGQANAMPEIDGFLRRHMGEPEQDLRNLINAMGELAQGIAE
ncbi:MAG: hypothetical protein RID11_09010 [Roseovarius sp.]|uniref:hypothetical protein n=1 Tax=Roseovarius sp. TaxID=1486281 RepID=UPI0032F07ADA